MASPANEARLPAWKRLGLKLRNNDQSGDAVTLNGREDKPIETPLKSGKSGDVKDRPIPNDTSRADVAKNEPLRPSKRKFEIDSAAMDHKPQKKKRHSAALNSAQEDVPVIQPLPPAGEHNEAVPDAQNAPSEDKARPKGDSNYRKKKSKNNGLNGISSREPVDNGSSTIRSTDQSQFATTDAVITTASPSELTNGQAHSREGEAPRTTAKIDAHDPMNPSDQLVKRSKKSKRTTEVATANQASSTPALIRRKSVTFTPETKTADGNSASNLFKAWAAQQKGPSGDFTSEQVAEFSPPPKVHPGNDIPPPTSTSQPIKKAPKETVDEGDAKATKKKEKRRDKNSEDSEKTTTKKSKTEVPKNASTTPTTTKNPALYLEYLSNYHGSRDTWKFNKAKQSDLLKHALDVTLIPPEYSEALNEYIKGLQGAAARDRLKEAASSLLKELSDTRSEDPAMDDPAVRKAAHDQALQKHLDRQKKRRREETELAELADASDPAAHMRSLKRRRAEDLVHALAFSAAAFPISTPAVNGVARKMVFQDEPTVPSKPKTRARKRRTAVSDDESSSSDGDSSSSEESSESSAESEDSDATDAGSGADSEGEASGEEDSSNPASGSESEDGAKDDRGRKRQTNSSDEEDSSESD